MGNIRRGAEKMSDWALFWGVAAMLCAAYALHGGHLAQRWGVDPSRRAPGTMAYMPFRRRVFAGLFALEMLIVLLVLMACVFGFACNLYGETVGVVIGMLYVVACGAMGFAVLFVCVRTDMDLAHLAEEELFEDAKDLMYFLEIVTVVSLIGMMMKAAYLIMSVENFLVWGSVVWLVLFVMGISHRLAGMIHNEQQIRPITYGGAVSLGVLAMACYTAWEKMKTLAESPAAGVLIITFLICSILIPIQLGGDAIRGLLKSDLPKKNKTPDFVWTLLSAVLGAATVLVHDRWTIFVSLAAGGCYVLLVIIICIRWFYRIGRGLFSGI